VLCSPVLVDPEVENRREEIEYLFVLQRLGMFFGERVEEGEHFSHECLILI
jgi:hypothetical protein